MLDDGVFEVMFIRLPKTRLDLNESIATLVGGNDTKMIEAFKTSSLTVIAEEEIPWTLDGEYGGEHTMVEIRNLKHAVEIMLPVNDKAPLINNVNETQEESREPELSKTSETMEEPGISSTLESSGKPGLSETPGTAEAPELFRKPEIMEETEPSRESEATEELPEK